MRQWSVRTQVICLVPAVAITAYGAYAFWGPYRWIAQLQMRWFGAYELKVTLIFTLLAIAVALWPVALLLERRESAERSPGVGGVRGTTPRGVGGDARDLKLRVGERACEPRRRPSVDRRERPFALARDEAREHLRVVDKARGRLSARL